MSIKNELWAKREELLKKAERCKAALYPALKKGSIKLKTYKNKLSDANTQIENLTRETPESLLEHY